MDTQKDTIDKSPMLDLEEAVLYGQDEHLCTSGEKEILKTFLSLPFSLKKLYIKLIQRKYRIVRVSSFDEDHEPLLQMGFLSTVTVSRAETLSFYSLKELHELCKVFNIKKTGKKDLVISRLVNIDVPLPTLIYVHYTSLFSRIFSLYTLQHECNWAHLHIIRTKQYTFFPYVCTNMTLHPSRKHYTEYRYFRSLYLRQEQPSRTPLVSIFGVYRFAPHRFYRKALFNYAQQCLPKKKKEACHAYVQLLPHLPSLIRLLQLYPHHKYHEKIWNTAQDLRKTLHPRRSPPNIQYHGEDGLQDRAQTRTASHV